MILIDCIEVNTNPKNLEMLKMSDINNSNHAKIEVISRQNENFEFYGLRILRAMRRIIRGVDIHSRKLNTQFKVTTPQVICLYSLVKDGAQTLSQLAANVNLGKSTVNGIVDRLENKGFLTRERQKQDRRKVYIKISEDGRKLIKDVPSLLQDRLTEALIKLPELEQAAIALSLERIVELMEVSHLDTSPNLLPESTIKESEKKV